MGDFQGITPQAMWLLAENRFHDSKSYYEAHKPDIQRQVIQPLRALVADLAPSMLEIDARLVVTPGSNGTVSRVRRDNRYTKDKSMYRENMWIAFQRDKKIWEFTPGFYLDISASQSIWGMGFYQAPPAFLQFLRRRVDERPAPYTKAMKQAGAAGFSPDGPAYARPKRPDAPEALWPLYNCKVIDMVRTEEGCAFFGGPELTETLRQGFAALAPLYRLLIRDVEAWVAQMQ